MKQVLIHAGSASVEEIPAPMAEPGRVLVKVENSCISIGTEMAGVRESGTPLWKKALKPQNVKRVVEMVASQGVAKTRSLVEGKITAGTPSGYSAAGVVIGVGQGVLDLKPGDRVACAGAAYAHHAEVVCVPRNLTVRVPDGLGMAEASTVTLGAIAMQGVRRANPTLGETFVVIGMGILGQITAQLLKADGARVVGTDLDAARVRRALDLGMDAALDPDDPDTVAQVARLTDGIGADGVIITAAGSSDEIVSLAFQMCRRKGRVVLVGDVGLGLKREDIYQKELDFLISTSYGPGRYDRRYEEEGLDYPVSYVRWTENRNMSEYLRLLGEGRVNVTPLIDKVYPIDEAPAAYEELKSGAGKPLMVLLSYPRAAADVVSHRVPNPGAPPARPGRVRLAVVGAGGFAKGMHLPNIHALTDLYHIRAIVSRTGHNAQQTAKQFAAEYATTDYTEVLGDPEIDAVLIATRHDLHARMTLDALRAGKHVLVEKPLALTREELAEIVAFFEGAEQPPFLLTGFNRRFSPFAKRIAELTSARKSPMMITYRMNAGYIPLDHWVHTAEGGGRNIGEACHIYDLFTFLTGSRVSRVTTAGARPTGYYSPRDNFTASVSFEDGSVATLTYTAMGSSEQPKEQMEVFCEGAVYVLDDYQDLAIKGSKADGVKTSLTDKGQQREVIEFAEAIRAGGEWPIPLWQQEQAMRIAFEVEDQLGEV